MLVTFFDDAVGKLEKYYRENCKNTTQAITLAVKGSNLNNLTF